MGECQATESKHASKVISNVLRTQTSQKVSPSQDSHSVNQTIECPILIRDIKQGDTQDTLFALKQVPKRMSR